MTKTKAHTTRSELEAKRIKARAELESKLGALEDRINPVKVIKRTPIIGAGMALAAVLLLSRMFRRPKRQKKESSRTVLGEQTKAEPARNSLVSLVLGSLGGVLFNVLRHRLIEPQLERFAEQTIDRLTGQSSHTDEDENDPYKRSAGKNRFR